MPQPLAGGLLTGKHQLMRSTSGSEGGSAGSFEKNAFYQERYWKRELFAALDEVRAACDAQPGGLGMAEASIRWLCHHSALRGNHDGVLLGASVYAAAAREKERARALR